MTDVDLLDRARSGDGEAFRALTGPHRRELLAHCYRMLASAQDAEDAVQDTMLAAWQGLGSFAGRASVRTWLYRIATNRCLNALRCASRRPAGRAPALHHDPAGPPRPSEVTWLGLTRTLPAG
jgi:RNA polymerase sigma factor (sigma-70 family)